jgi:hypothetical protein
MVFGFIARPSTLAAPMPTPKVGTATRDPRHARSTASVDQNDSNNNALSGPATVRVGGASRSTGGLLGLPVDAAGIVVRGTVDAPMRIISIANFAGDQMRRLS